MRTLGNRKSNVSDPFSVALRLLTFRDRSTTELAKKLQDRGFSRTETEAVINRCLELGYLDDERFANARARSLVNSGRAVGIRLLNELKKAGIDRSLAEQALAEAESEVDLAELADEIRQRKFPGFVFSEATDKEKNRVVSYLQRRGFPVSMILDVLKN
jgi:regulatory protein